MANQPPHEWNANIYHKVEKESRDTITLAQTVVKNVRSKNLQIVSVGDPLTTVGDLSNVVCTLLEVIEEQGVVRIPQAALRRVLRLQILTMLVHRHLR
jgi:hypothetical protein